jgi:hypothetical protein
MPKDYTKRKEELDKEWEFLYKWYKRAAMRAYSRGRKISKDGEQHFKELQKILAELNKIDRLEKEEAVAAQTVLERENRRVGK